MVKIPPIVQIIFVSIHWCSDKRHVMNLDPCIHDHNVVFFHILRINNCTGPEAGMVEQPGFEWFALVWSLVVQELPQFLVMGCQQPGMRGKVGMRGKETRQLRHLEASAEK